MTRQLAGSTFSLLAASRNLREWNMNLEYPPKYRNQDWKKKKKTNCCISHFRRWLPRCHFITPNDDREGFLPPYIWKIMINKLGIYKHKTRFPWCMLQTSPWPGCMKFVRCFYERIPWWEDILLSMSDLLEFEANANGTPWLLKCLIKRSAPGSALMLDHLKI